MLRAIVPRNARSKRALEARAPKEIEDERTAIFVRGSHTGEVLNSLMKDLIVLKRPHGISFSKKNEIHPFEPAGVQSLEFWSTKNDATFFVVGTNTKKRPNNLTLVRIYDNKVLDMLEVGIRNFKSMQDFKTPKSTPGHKPLMQFASPLFDTHPRFIQLKQHLIALFNGEAIESIALAGIEHVISVQLSPLPNPAQPLPGQMTDDPALLPTVHLRTYTLSLKSSSTRVPYIELVPMGPSADLTLRRFTEPDPVLLAAALKRPKMAKRDVEKGLGDKKKMRNREVDEMGDLRGRIHLGKQDLSGLKRKGVKALKRGWEEVADEPRDIEANAESGGESGMDVTQLAVDSPRKKRRQD